MYALAQSSSRCLHSRKRDFGLGVPFYFLSYACGVADSIRLDPSMLRSTPSACMRRMLCLWILWLEALLDASLRPLSLESLDSLGYGWVGGGGGVTCWRLLVLAGACSIISQSKRTIG